MPCERNSRSLTIGPPTHPRGTKETTPIVPPSQIFMQGNGTKPFASTFHVLLPARVSICTTVELKRPSSAAYGFGTTSTDSIESPGSSTPKLPVDGSFAYPAPT